MDRARVIDGVSEAIVVCAYLCHLLAGSRTTPHYNGSEVVAAIVLVGYVDLVVLIDIDARVPSHVAARVQALHRPGGPVVPCILQIVAGLVAVCDVRPVVAVECDGKRCSDVMVALVVDGGLGPRRAAQCPVGVLQIPPAPVVEGHVQTVFRVDCEGCPLCSTGGVEPTIAVYASGGPGAIRPDRDVDVVVIVIEEDDVRGVRAVQLDLAAVSS